MANCNASCPQIFIKAFPRGSDGRSGLLEATGLVEIDDCLTAINGVPLAKSASLREIMASIRSAKSPLALRFARYPLVPSSPPPPILSPQLSATSLPGQLPTEVPRTGSATSFSTRPDSTGHGTRRRHTTAEISAAADGGNEIGEDKDLDDVLNSALVLGLGERVAGVQKRNAQLLLSVDRVQKEAATKRQGVEQVASAAASLSAAGGSLSGALRTLATARQDASALCEAMARLDELLAARERAQATRRRSYEAGYLMGGGDTVGGSDISGGES